MKNLAVITLAVDAHVELGEVSQPTMRSYAEKLGADFIVISSRVYKNLKPQYEKFQLRKHLDEYRRIFYIDADAVIRSDTPNIFDMVPEGRLGAVVEKVDGQPAPYINSGVMVIDQAHKFIFDPPFIEGLWYDQAHINSAIQKNPAIVFGLPVEFNFRPLVRVNQPKELWKTAYIIHFANLSVPVDHKKKKMQCVLDDWSKEHE
jgi:hypothetical protein